MICYALIASDEPGRIRYVGQTIIPAARLKAHITEAIRRNTPKGQWIAEVLARGATIRMIELSSHTTCQEAADAEWHWIRHYLSHGPLFNRDLGWKMPRGKRPHKTISFDEQQTQ